MWHRAVMLFALLYALLRRVIGSGRPSADRELEIEVVVLRHWALQDRADPPTRPVRKVDQVEIETVGYINSGRGLVFVDETAQQRPLVNFRGPQVIDRWPWVSARRPKVQPAMRPRLVVVPNVGAKDALKVSSADDERPIQAFGTDGAHPPFAERVGVRGPDRGEDDPHAFWAEHLVEGVGELGVPVVDQEPRGSSFILERHGQVPRLLGDPSRVGVRSHSTQVDRPRPELDPHKHVQGLQPDRLHGEEVARQDPCRLLPQERPPRRATPGERVPGRRGGAPSRSWWPRPLPRA